MVAMATMVASFRHSLEIWLERVLPADLYVRAAATAAGGATSASFSAADQQRMRDAPGVARAAFNRTLRVSLDPARAPVVLIARGIERADAALALPLTGAALTWRAGMPPPCWVSEAIVDLYGARLGQDISLPIAEQAQRFVVAGVWRDYARQTGAIVIEASVYQQLTGDNTRTEAALWLQPGAHGAEVTRQLAAQLATRSAEFNDASTIRALSLRIFDRSFAVTYALELAAIAIGLVGIAATFSSQAIARQREFGMLRHLGATRGQILAMLALEAVLLTLAAIAVGLAAGLAIAWILVAIVNPQSFHWTMDLALPLGTLASLTVALLACAAITARIAGRRAVAAEAVLAVRADW